MRLSSGERHPTAPSVVGAGKVGGTRATEGVAHPVISEQGKIQYGLEGCVFIFRSVQQTWVITIMQSSLTEDLE